VPYTWVIQKLPHHGLTQLCGEFANDGDFVLGSMDNMLVRFD